MILLTITQLYAQNYSISGHVKSLSTKEPLVGASIQVKGTNFGTQTDDTGYFSLNIPKDTYALEISYLGFNKQQLEINLLKDTSFAINLEEDIALLEDIVVASSGSYRNVNQVEMSINSLSSKTMKQLPSFLGEVEILRSLLLLPGITTVGEGASGFNVRGGNTDQNLLLQDGAPIYNASHLLGFFSVFNPDAVKDVKLYKGNIPANYGGRLSSVVDVTLKEGNKDRTSINGGLGLIFSRLSLETPLVKDKASIIVSGRRSYIDILAQPFLTEENKGSALNFYDLTFKLDSKLGKRDRVSATSYLGRDNFRIGNESGFTWGNKTASLRWNHLFNNKFSSSLVAYYSFYDYMLDLGIEDEEDSFDWKADIKNYSLKSQFTYYLSPQNILRLGWQGILYHLHPGRAMAVSEGEEVDLSLTQKNGLETAFFLEHEVFISKKLTLQYGLRHSAFNYLGRGRAYEFAEAAYLDFSRPPVDYEEFGAGESIHKYNNWEPRAALQFKVNERHALKASYSLTSQYIHFISNTTASLPIDVWTVSSQNIPPQRAHLYSLGYFHHSKNKQFEGSAEIYYKRMFNLIEFTSDADLILNEFIEGSLLVGIGRAYGLELFGKKQEGRLTGWISYGLSKTERQIEGINQDNWFPARFDQTHNLSVATFYSLNNRWSMGANFTFNTGTPTTFPNSRFEQQGYILPYDVFQSRNNTRLPAYHRLDLSFTLHNKHKPNKKWKDSWVFSLYNVYGRRNPFDIFFRQNPMRALPGQPISTEAVQLSVIGSVIPAVSYNFKL